MKHIAWFCICLGAVMGCGGTVEDNGGATDNAGPSTLSTPDAGSPRSSEVGIPCSYLHGLATLTDYRGSSYAASAFSFEYASQDPAVTGNEFDLLYSDDAFTVNMVTDDRSFIVDLGSLPLTNVPAMVRSSDYSSGRYGNHDAVQAQLGHAYFVRSVDSTGRLVSAFRVIGFEPGRKVRIDWIRSTDSDMMVVPTACGLE